MTTIPETMPYTFEDILKCKDITFEQVLGDYQSLCKFPAETNPRKLCGNRTIYQYQFRELLKCRRDSSGYKILEEWFEDPELKEKLWKDSIKRNRNDRAPFPSPVDVYECHRINNGAIVLFKPSTAKYLYKKFGATSVLDPTMGWGGRMLGATSLGIRYTGFDTNIDLKNGYENMIGDLKLPNVKLFWETSLNEEIIKTLDYDMVLTSPPYSNLELYEHMTPWETDDEFYKEFLIPLMNLCMKYLKAGGVNCWNISPKMYKVLTEKYNYPKCDTQEDLRQSMGKQYKTKSQDYTYIWCKGKKFDSLVEGLPSKKETKKENKKTQINRMNPTLVSGFEDVITHIKQQEQRVMGLEEENKKLKAENEKLKEEMKEKVAFSEQVRKECKVMLTTVADGISKKDLLNLQEENKKLKEDLKSSEDKVKDRDLEIYDLKEDVYGGVLIEQIAELFGSDEGDQFEFHERITQMIQENKKLEAKILRLQSSEEGLEKKLDTGGWSPTSSPEPKQ